MIGSSRGAMLMVQVQSSSEDGDLIKSPLNLGRHREGEATALHNFGFV